MRHVVAWIVMLSFLPITAAFGQVGDTIIHRWSFGISCGEVLHRLFNADPSDAEYAAFVLDYTGKALAWQIGVRPGYNRKHIEHEGFLDTEVSKKSMISGNVALTHVFFQDRKWSVRAGLQYEGGRSREDIIEDSGFDLITTRRLEWNNAFGIVADARVFVHPRISFGLATSLVYVMAHSEVQQLFTNFPDFNTTKTTEKDNGVEVHEPATIYLRYHF